MSSSFSVTVVAERTCAPPQANKKKWLVCGKAEAQLPVPGKGTAPVAFNEEGVHIAAGQRQAFYVHCKDHMTAVSFVNRPLAEDGSILREVSQHGNFTD